MAQTITEAEASHSLRLLEGLTRFAERLEQANVVLAGVLAATPQPCSDVFHVPHSALVQWSAAYESYTTQVQRVVLQANAVAGVDSAEIWAESRHGRAGRSMP